MDLHVFPIPRPPSHLPPHLIPLGLSSAPALSTCLMHPTWAGFTLDSIIVSMLFSQNIPPSPSPTESNRLFNTSVSLLLSHIQGCHYHLSKFHICAFYIRNHCPYEDREYFHLLESSIVLLSKSVATLLDRR